MIDNEREYEEMYEELLHIVTTDAGAPRFRDGYRKVGHIATGWFSRIHRSVQAVRVLEDAGLSVEAAPIRRTIIEHVVALSWLAAEGDKVADTVKNAHAEWVTLTKKNIENAGWSSVDLDEFDAVIKSAAGGDKSNDHLKRFMHQANKYSTSDTVIGYLAETGQSHPMWESAAVYLDPNTWEHLGEPRGAVPQTPFLVLELFGAVTFLSSTFDSVPWQERLEAISNRLRVATIRTRVTQGLSIPKALNYVPEVDIL